jgi:ABC-type nickel/cobalt efflux system permease component RcnA
VPQLTTITTKPPLTITTITTTTGTRMITTMTTAMGTPALIRLVPSPSALIVLLGAVGLGRTAFGVLLVVAYGLGMAATLTAAGLVLVRVRDRWTSRPRRTLARLTALAPVGTAALVLCVGFGLAGRATLGLI